jgi:hypothetical protein
LSATIYPSLPAPLDLGFLRVNGAGLGNCLFVYFHAVALAHRDRAQLIAPAWRSLAVNQKLRGDGTIRKYHRMLRPHPDELRGIAKLAALILGYARARRWAPRPGCASLPAARDGLTIVETTLFSFEALHPYRDVLRRRLVDILAVPAPEVQWGNGAYIGFHVRLGDFEIVARDAVAAGTVANARVPLDWFVEVAGVLRAWHPALPVHVFSDGSATELAPLLAVPGVTLRREANDVSDLIAMAGAAVLVGSHSTFSRWAAFLGGMPTIWHATAMAQDLTWCADPLQSQQVGWDVSILRDPMSGPS